MPKLYDALFHKNKLAPGLHQVMWIVGAEYVHCMGRPNPMGALTELARTKELQLQARRETADIGVLNVETWFPHFEKKTADQLVADAQEINRALRALKAANPKRKWLLWGWGPLTIPKAKFALAGNRSLLTL